MTTPQQLVILMQRVARQDRAAFAELYAATSSKLFGVVLRILRRRDLADEVLQEAYVKIWERAADYRPETGAVITWITTIARNRALDEARRKRPDSVEDHPEILNIATDAESALAAVMRGEDGQRLTDCLKRLEPARRDMVLLAYCEGLSREELAEKYGQPVNTIKTWLRRSLIQLKGCLAP